jgi:hypothetical protein
MSKPDRHPSRRRIAPIALAGFLFLLMLACSTSDFPGEAGDSAPTGEPAAPTDSSRTASPTPESENNGWPLILRETFDDNGNGWFTGKYEGDYIIETVTIQDGRYRWVTTAKESVTDYGFPDIGDFGDFRLTVEGRQLSGSGEAEYGLLFRSTEESDYSFGICAGTGEFYLDRYVNGEYEPLIDYTESSAIRSGDTNLLAVRARGSHFELFINGEKVGQADDSSIPFGEVAVFIYLNNPGDTAEFEFDNFEVYSPPEDTESNTV